MDNDDDDALMQAAMEALLHMRNCCGASAHAAGHCLVGCGVFALTDPDEVPVADALEHLDEVRRALDERVAELRAEAN